ncbi:RNA-binding protein [Vulcanibacillus modesticaldus]|uniref:RNA-binding protein n=1 Tax=Vulcanibacillus modesticaldus TaxID=337097 RepID=A0A1D2YV90_9BACI|nr:S4 domain-containing protein YaaA [Vulcanibacillus modesticaldus]OEF99630.1 RNA-binding protein [Vulcanibacillus modesticaldus]
MKEVFIDTEYITLGQLLKHMDFIQSGGQAKYFLAENKVYVNDQVEDRRGRKLYPEDIINVQDMLLKIKKSI